MSQEKTENIPPPSPPPPSLNDLPRELISQVTNYLAKPDLVPLLRTSTLLNSSIQEKQIWSKISLTLPWNFGELPLVQPFPKGGDIIGDYKMWTCGQRYKAQLWRESHLKAKVKSILLAGNAARWAMVESLTLEHRANTTVGMIQILDFVQPTVKSLAILGAGPRPRPMDWEEISWRTIDANIIDSGFCFTALKSVRFGVAALVFPQIISGDYFALWAPNATSADIDLSRYAEFDVRGDRWASYGKSAGETKLERLRIKFGDLWNRGGLDEESIEAIQSLLEASPCLRQLSVTYTGSYPGVLYTILEWLSENSKLEDLHLDGGCLELEGEGGLGNLRLDNLKRLVLKVDWSTMVDLTTRDIIDLPSIHKIYLDGCQSNADLSSLPTWPSIRGGYDSQYRGCPNLRVYHTLQDVIDKGDVHIFDRLDDVEQTAENGRICSLVHGDEELIFARHLVDYIRVTEDLLPGDVAYPTDQTLVTFQNSDGSEYDDLFMRPARPHWRQYSDYKELVVPFKVIDEVWAVHGASVKERRGRGIKVGDAAWKVLTDWYELEVADLAKEEVAADEAVVGGESAMTETASGSA